MNRPEQLTMLASKRETAVLGADRIYVFFSDEGRLGVKPIKGYVIISSSFCLCLPLRARHPSMNYLTPLNSSLYALFVICCQQFLPTNGRRKD
jgi:hypothetical protein